MAIDPEENPREFLTIAVATMLKVFCNKPWSDEEYFVAAEKFVAEAEKRYGKLNQ